MLGTALRALDPLFKRRGLIFLHPPHKENQKQPQIGMSSGRTTGLLKLWEGLVTCGELEAGIQCGSKILWWQRAGRPWWAMGDEREGQLHPRDIVGRAAPSQSSSYSV